MTRQDINIGSSANDGTGDTLRSAGTKINSNFRELYTQFGGDSTTLSSLTIIKDSGGTGAIIFEGTSADAFETKLMAANPTSVDKTVQLPDATGIIVLKDTTDTLTNKTLTSPVLTTPKVNDTSANHTYTLVPGELSANRNIKSYNPYFNNFTVDNRPDAINKLSNKTIFFLSKGSLASAYATIFNKPIVFFYSSNHPYESDEFKSIKDHSEILGTKPFDIKKYKKISFKKQLKIQKKSYTKYFNNLLRPNQKLFDKKNSTLISDFINSLK